MLILKTPDKNKCLDYYVELDIETEHVVVFVNFK